MTGPDLLAKYLDKHGLKRSEFARSTEIITESDLSRYISGTHTPTIDKALAIQKATHGWVPMAAWASEAA